MTLSDIKVEDLNLDSPEELINRVQARGRHPIDSLIIISKADLRIAIENRDQVLFCRLLMEFNRVAQAKYKQEGLNLRPIVDEIKEQLKRLEAELEL